MDVYGTLFLFLILSFSCRTDQREEQKMSAVKTIDLTPYSDAAPAKPAHLLFIHHSTGGQLLAEKGPDVGKDCIYQTQPNGGGLRLLLEKNNYIVHEASYNSLIGDKTDICHWNTKFRDHMDSILSSGNQDERLPENTRNRIILFKSCYPNNNIVADGTYPGDPDSCEKITANYEAAYRALLGYFEKHPETLFVVLTAPPLVMPKNTIADKIKVLLKREDTVEKIGKRARRFNNWLKDVDKGWLHDYTLNNVVVFDYYDVLTDNGQSNWSRYPSGEKDSHPNNEGNMKAAQAFIPFINRAVHRMGL